MSSRQVPADECGAAAVEFALALFLLLPLVVGLIDIGAYMKAQSRVVNAANAGAAFAANHPGSVSAGCSGGSITDSALAEDSTLSSATVEVYDMSVLTPPLAPAITGCTNTPTTYTKVRVVCILSYTLPIKMFWSSPRQITGYRDVVVLK